MRLRRFYVPHTLGETITSGPFSVVSSSVSSAPLVHQLKNVFRLGKGDEIVLFDNSGFDFFCTIEGFGSGSNMDELSFTITKKIANNVLPTKETYLFVSLIKKDNFEWIAQKATELGVSHIVPILSERSEKKDLNFERLQKIIIEASEQSGRGTLPILNEIIDLEKALHEYGHIKSIAWHTEATKFVSQDIESIIGAYIGPEGGWSAKELEIFKKHGIPTRSLGPQVLRAETAVIAVISRLVF